jgi:hypothetical protein
MSAVRSPALQLFDETYRQKMSDLHLFVQAGKSQFQFAFFDPYAKQIIGMESWELDGNENWHQISERLSAILSQEPFDTEFKSVSFALVDSLFTLVPSSLFDSSKRSEYLKLNHRLNDPSELIFFSEEISGLNSQLVYAYPQILYNYLSGRFSKLSVHHSLVPCLEAFSLEKKNQACIHLHIQSDRFDLIYFNDGKLQMVNSFGYQTVEDFIYYLLYVMEQMKIDRDSNQLTLYGEFELRSSLHDLIFEYVRRPELKERSQKIKYSRPLDELPRHQFVNLFNLYLCG